MVAVEGAVATLDLLSTGTADTETGWAESSYGRIYSTLNLLLIPTADFPPALLDTTR
jgi:hypothetical protein